ncbi:MAG: helix-hairpin-helix domain-containing protein [Bacteroidales bacterium]|nr:helix-hairpin-helix domain-containing protein [Bacteroidales bacterium]
MWEKEKISKSLSIGLIALVFIFLSLQFVFFVAKVIQIRKYNMELAAEQSVAGENQFVAGGESSVARRESSEVGDKSSAASVAGGGIPATENREKWTRDGEKTAAATENRENQSRESASSVQSSSAGAVARAFSLEKLPPRPTYKPKPKVELNSADTTALMTLYGIGGYYARKIVDFRKRLGGSFASPEQLMDIYGIDSARYVGFADRVYVDTSLIVPLNLYNMPLDSMAKHPYIGKYAARGIDRYRRTVDSASFTLDALMENGILQSAYVQRLRLYIK